MRRLVRLTVAAALALVAAPVTATSSQASVWDTGPVIVTRDVTPTPRVVDLRVREHTHFDRITIDLHGKVPGYRTRYVRTLRYDGSGNPVPLRGRKFIEFVVIPARAHNASGPVYEGPVLRQYHLPTLRGVALTGDFEGQVSFGFSLRSKQQFRVSERHSPNVLRIDLHH